MLNILTIKLYYVFFFFFFRLYKMHLVIFTRFTARISYVIYECDISFLTFSYEGD